MNIDPSSAANQKAASDTSNKKISLGRARYLRYHTNFVITEEIVLRKYGYRYFEEVPESRYKEIKSSLFSLKARLSHDRRKWENNRKAKGLDYKPKPIYENNERVF